MLGCEWREAHDNTFECVVVRKTADHPGLQGFFYTFPDLTEYPTKDLYRPHPSLPDHWKYYGRADNVIVFSNGEKLNPVTIEETIQSHPRIKGALVVGSNRFQAGLLLEPSIHIRDDVEKAKLIESIWPLVERANKETVAHGRIGRAYIAVVGQPFLRAGKGTVQRALTVDLLADEIEQLYSNTEGLLPAVLPSLELSSAESLATSIKKILELEGPDLHLEVDTNIFSVGVDSRQTINTVRLLRASLKAAGYASTPESLGPRAIYNNPTCRRLAKHIYRIHVQPEMGLESENQNESQTAQEEKEMDVMKDLHKRHTQDLPRAKPGRPNMFTNSQTVILTGSTGTLGSHLLARLARDPAVARIVCLNRGQDGGAARQSQSMAQRGLPIAQEYNTKAEFHHADASLPRLGLDPATYADLVHNVDRVIHCAWPVNFNFTTETFEPHIRGARHLADLAASARKRVAVVFVSSVSTVARWDPASHGSVAVPEEALADWSLPAPSGYARSKMVASLVLDAAAATDAGDFIASTVRLGQIAGPEEKTGGIGAAWSSSDWLPSIVASSLHLGALPSDLGTADRVDWLPAERAAAAVLDVALAPPEELGGYFHAVNTAAVPWRELVPAVRDFYGAARVRELVSFDEWIARLEEAGPGLENDDASPGLKLLDTYKGMMWRGEGRQPVVFDTSRASRISPSMRNSKAVSPDLMRYWCLQWGF
jgi:thioester reductase-like protein